MWVNRVRSITLRGLSDTFLTTPVFIIQTSDLTAEITVPLRLIKHNDCSNEAVYKWDAANPLSYTAYEEFWTRAVPSTGQLEGAGY